MYSTTVVRWLNWSPDFFTGRVCCILQNVKETNGKSVTQNTKSNEVVKHNLTIAHMMNATE